MKLHKLTMLMLFALCLGVMTEKPYKMILFGDNGEINFFRQHAFPNTRGKSPDEAIDARNKYYEDFKKEIYVTDNGQCKVTLNGETTDLEQKDGMVNFENIMCNSKVVDLIKESDSGAFLGDVLYVENKNSHHVDKNGEGIVDFKKLWNQRILCGWNMFYKILEKCPKGMGDNALVKDDKMNSNFHILGGNHSFDAIVSSEATQATTKTDKILGPSFLTKKKILHETQQITYVGATEEKIKTTIETVGFTKFPKFIKSIVQDHPHIEMIDINSQVLGCLYPSEYVDKVGSAITGTAEEILATETARYKECVTGGFNPLFGGPQKMMPNGSYPRLDQARRYLGRFVEALSMFTDEANWKLIRAHHPPTNVEDGDELFYFYNLTLVEDKKKPGLIEKLTEWGNKKKLFSKGALEKTEKDGVKGLKVNLMKVFQAINLKIFLASHTHSAQLIVYPYETNQKSFNCANKRDNLQCLAVNPEVFSKHLVHSYVDVTHECDAQTYNFDSSKEHSDNLYIFITGNSGRYFDLVKDDNKTTKGMLVWARSKHEGSNASDSSQSHFGFSNIEMTKDTAVFKFYEVPTVTQKDLKTITTTATFNFKLVKDPVHYQSVENYLTHRCPNALVANTASVLRLAKSLSIDNNSSAQTSDETHLKKSDVKTKDTKTSDEKTKDTKTSDEITKDTKTSEISAGKNFMKK